MIMNSLKHKLFRKLNPKRIAKRISKRTDWHGLLMTILLAHSPIAMGAQQSVMSCQDMNQLTIDKARVTVAEVVEAGEFVPPAVPGQSVDRSNGAQGRNSPYRDLPAFCRVALTLTPSADSDIQMELWLPTANWNGKYLAVGNGAFTGNVRHPALVEPLSRGYATSSTDTGHTGNTASFGLGHPEKVIDFGWRAVNGMARVSKALIENYYASGPQYSYWNGCSAGGRQAMQAAQRFPADFDGIIAGAPGLDWTGRAAAALRVARVLEADESARLGPEQRLLVHQAVLNACDADDGLQDGLISVPQQCRFDPAELQCNNSNAAACLNPPQVETVHMLYSSPANPSTGRPITGLLPGSELGWTDLGWTQSARDTGEEQYRYLVYADPDWTIDRFDFDRDIVKAEEDDANTLNALDADLQPFFARGGKLIQYHGLSDPQISPANATQYYQRVSDALGGRDRIHDSFRLFMAPGMAHCGGGEGPDTFDMLTSLENWVERGLAPNSVIAEQRTNGRVDRSRPLCPYPEVAVYNGSGDVDRSESFQCQLP